MFRISVDAIMAAALAVLEYSVHLLNSSDFLKFSESLKMHGSSEGRYSFLLVSIVMKPFAGVVLLSVRMSLWYRFIVRISLLAYARSLVYAFILKLRWSARKFY